MINKRIKELRKLLGLSQKEFGDSLGLTRDQVASIENNRVVVQKMTVKCICREFGVDELWLEDGEGSMMAQTDETSNEIVQIFNMLDSNLQEYALYQIRGLLEVQEKAKR